MDDMKLKKILSETPSVEVDQNARKRAVNLALAEFQAVQTEKNKNSSQGVSFLSRLMGMSNTPKGRSTMEHKKKFIYGGMATAMAVIFVAALSVSQIDEATQRFAKTTTPGITEPAPAYIEAIEQKNEANLEEALQTGGSTLPVPVVSSKDLKIASDDAAGEKKRDYQAGSRPAKKQESFSEQTEADIVQTTPLPMAPAQEYEMGAARQDLAKSKEAVASSIANNAVADSAYRRADDKSVIAPYPMPPIDVIQPQPENRDQFTEFKPSSFKQVAIEPVSTFSSDVDTASYSFVRRQLNNGQWPQADAVRVEEMINYFDYNYPLPESKTEPFKPTVTIMDNPWAKGKKLMHIGIQGYDITENSKPQTNLVFLLDVSGSMDEPNKLPLVKSSMKMLLESLKPDDTIAITVYAGAAGTVLEPTKVSERHKILSAIDNLNAGGSTAGEAGIRLAYQLAEQNFNPEGINRVILATDGDFNVGTSSTDDLKTLVEQKRESGIFLSVLGFGQGNYNDAIMQTLAQNGNGVAAYIDTLNEARKVLVEEANSSLFPIAKDVKFQVEFNPATVAEYRLVGYETRALNREDFNNDQVDAGDIGAGHTVTAIYEFVPVGSEAVSVDPLRYGMGVEAVKKPTPANGEYAFLKMRYKLPNEDVSKLITTPVMPQDTKASADVNFSVAVAAFGQILKNDSAVQSMTLDDVIALASSAKGNDPFGYRAEFISLVRLAKSTQR